MVGNAWQIKGGGGKEEGAGSYRALALTPSQEREHGH